MSGTRRGGKLAALENMRKYGPDFYKEIGSKGGSAPGRPKGFAHAAANGLNWHKEAGKKGGSISRKGTIKVRPDSEGTKDHPDVTDERS